MKAYKGMSKDMTAYGGFKYEPGKTYEVDGEIYCCGNGFHACEAPLDVLHYYPLNKGNRYFLVEQDGDMQKREDKTASRKITIGAEIGLPGLIKAHVEYTKELSQKHNNATSGYRSSAATSGDWSSAATSGYRSSAATSGNGSSAATSGEESSAATSNVNGIALACGKNSRAKGVVGSYIVLTEWDDGSKNLLTARLERVDGEKIKADTWYTMKNGEFVEVYDD